MTICDNRSSSAISPVISPIAIGEMASPTVSVGSPIDSEKRREFEGKFHRLVNVPARHVIAGESSHPDSQRRFVPSRPTQLLQFLESSARNGRMDSVSVRAYQRAWGNTHRQAVRIVLGHRVSESVGLAPNSHVPPRCRGRLTTFQRACASRRPRADRPRPPDARRSTPRSRPPMPARARSRRPARRCSSARSDLSCDS